MRWGQQSPPTVNFPAQLELIKSEGWILIWQKWLALGVLSVVKPCKNIYQLSILLSRPDPMIQAYGLIVFEVFVTFWLDGYRQYLIL